MLRFDRRDAELSPVVEACGLDARNVGIAKYGRVPLYS